MKKIFPWLVFVVVAAQIIWLGWNYHARCIELATAPRCRIAFNTYDPRDPVRGYYQSLYTDIRYDLADAAALFGTSIDQRGLKEAMLMMGEKEESCNTYPSELNKDYTPDIRHSATATEICKQRYNDFTLIAFWQQKESGLWEIGRLEHENSPEDAAREGEIRIPMEAHWRINEEPDHPKRKWIVSAEMRLTFIGMRSLRYYYPEKKGDFFSILHQQSVDTPTPDDIPRRVDITVELLVRPHAGIIPTQMYLNDIPYNEATELLKQDKFPFRPSPAPAT